MAGTTSISGDLSKTNLPNKVQKEREDLEKEKKNFLTFFIESLKGQDPTSPMDHSQLTNTILSFQNTSNLMDIKGILHTNLDKSDDTKLSEASSHLGQDVIIKGNDLELAASFSENGQEGVRAKIMYKLEEKADSVMVLIKDEHGNIISELQSSKMDKGKNIFEWNGEIIKNGLGQGKIAKPGKYTYEVQAVDSNNEPIKVTTFSSTVNTIDQISFDDSNNVLFGIGNKSVTQGQIYGYKSKKQDQFSGYGINKEIFKAKLFETTL